MFSLRSILTTSMLAVPMFLATGAASAAVVAGTSSGSFSDITGCNGDNCRVNNTGYGSSTQVEWGYRNGIFGNDGSTLTAVNTSFSQSTDANDLILAELVWVNLATPANVTPDDFNVRYTLKINFTSPNASNDTEAFDLVITNPTNSTGDNIQGMTMTDLSNLSFSLNGVMISDLKYKLGGGAGSNFNNNVWYNPENTTSRMYITADFKAVPEPASLGLLAAGLFGIGVMRRRKNA